MKAVQYREVGAPPEVVTVADLDVGPGQVLLDVLAAGLCHSDIAVMGWPAEQLPFALPMTLGHEAVGKVAAIGDGTAGVAVGDVVAVYGPWGCGRCRLCAQGKENYCLRAGELGITPPGLGHDGALADQLLVDDARHLVPLDGLDPVAAVPLTDAGLTPYHAIKAALGELTPGTTAVVIGTGGLGHIGIQLLRALTPSRVIALDVTEDKLILAREVGAHEVLLSDAAAAGSIRDLTGGVGAQAVFDFVGVQSTVDLALACAGVEADVTIVGIGGGTASVAFGQVAYDVAVRTPYWGSRSELIEVLDLACSGAIAVHTERYDLDAAPDAYALLHEGRINGRAVVVP